MTNRVFHQTLVLSAVCCLLQATCSELTPGPVTSMMTKCQNTDDCWQQWHRSGLQCIQGYCRNPFENGGCLKQMLPGWKRARICNSEDSAENVNAGDCRESTMDYLEVRIASQNWESAFFQGWILQILLSELLNVPVTIETGSSNAKVSFYDPESRMDHGNIGYDWDAIERANAVGDCRLVVQDPRKRYQSCAHVIPEVWESQSDLMREAEKEGTIDKPQNTGVLGQQGLFIPKFTGQRDPALLSYLGLQSQQNRRKVAESFLRPTRWSDYCKEVSNDNCSSKDPTAARPPVDENEGSRFFVEGLYQGYFRATDDNDCDMNPTTCMGHVVDMPCSWNSYVPQQLHHLSIPMKTDANDVGETGFLYEEMKEIWHAANATKSNVMMQWWSPEELYETFLGTDSEFLRVVLPPPTQECIDNRVDPTKRCSVDERERYGSSKGSCEEPSHSLKRVVVSTLKQDTEDLSTPDEIRSPAYDAIKALELSELQIGEIFQSWLKTGDGEWNANPRDATCQFVVENIDFFSSLMPPDHPRKVQNATGEYFVDALFFGILFFGALAALLVVLSIAGTYIHRTKRIIQESPIELLCLLLTGLLMVSVGSILMMLPFSGTSCVLTIWLINVGYALEIAPLIVCCSVSNHLAMKTQRGSIRELVMQVLPFCFLVVLFLVAWTVFDPPQKDVIYELSGIKEEAIGEVIVQEKSICRSNSELWKYASMAWLSLLLVFGALLTLCIRNETNGPSARSLATSHLIYSHLLFMSLRTILLFFEDVFEDQLGVGNSAQYLSFLFSGDIIAACFLYFFPLFYASGSREPVLDRRTESNAFRPADIVEQRDTKTEESEHTSTENSDLISESGPKMDKPMEQSTCESSPHHNSVAQTQAGYEAREKAATTSISGADVSFTRPPEVVDISDNDELSDLGTKDDNEDLSLEDILKTLTRGVPPHCRVQCEQRTTTKLNHSIFPIPEVPNTTGENELSAVLVTEFQKPSDDSSTSHSSDDDGEEITEVVFVFNE